MKISIPYKAVETMMRRTLIIRVERGTDFQLIGGIIAACIGSMENNPNLSAKDALISAISQKSQGNTRMAARLGMECGKYADDLSQGHGARYFDLQIVHVDDGQPGPSWEEACELQQRLAATLDAGRVSLCESIEGDAAETFRDSAVEALRKAQAENASMIVFDDPVT